jgi:hypothetical protein
VTSVTAGSGLTGGTITGSGTIALDFYAGSAANNTNFPIGSYILVVSLQSSPSQNNQAMTIYVSNTGSAFGYNTSTLTIASPIALTGTWRFRGGLVSSGCCGTFSSNSLFQRVA